MLGGYLAKANECWHILNEYLCLLTMKFWKSTCTPKGDAFKLLLRLNSHIQFQLLSDGNCNIHFMTVHGSDPSFKQLTHPCEHPYNMDTFFIMDSSLGPRETNIMQSLEFAPSVSVLQRFHCTSVLPVIYSLFKDECIFVLDVTFQVSQTVAFKIQRYLCTLY